MVFKRILERALFPGSSVVKDPPAMQKTQVQSLSLDDPLEKGMATHSSILTWRIPWTEESGKNADIVSLVQISGE